jgi:citrate lyase subunit beta/citryl-CoA lyase
LRNEIARPVPRSYLFVPASRSDRFEKALNTAAHAVIIDFEDGVALAAKQSARDAVSQWLNSAQPVVLRINGAETEWFADDLALCAAPGVSAVMLPKAESVDQVRAVASRIASGVGLLPQIESARGFANALAIAECEGVQRLAFGPLDLQVDLAILGDDEELLFFRSQLVLVSRLAGVLAPIDGPTTAIDDAELLRAHAARARRLGFGGKLCIHPKQVAITNECFSPSSEDVAWATKIVRAAAESKDGAVAVDGKMVDRPVILQAERILSEVARVSSE